MLAGCFSLTHFLFPAHDPTAKIKRAKEMLPSNCFQTIIHTRRRLDVPTATVQPVNLYASAVTLQHRRKNSRTRTNKPLPPASFRPRQRLGVGRRPPQEDAGHSQGRHVGSADLGHRAADGAALQPVPAQQEQPDGLRPDAAAQEEGRAGGRGAQELEYRHFACRGRQAFQVSSV